MVPWVIAPGQYQHMGQDAFFKKWQLEFPQGGALQAAVFAFRGALRGEIYGDKGA